MASSRVSGHRMVIASFTVTLVTLVAIVLIGLALEAGSGRDPSESDAGTPWTVRLLRFTVIFGVPLAATSAALVVRGRPAAIATRAVASVVLLLWSLLFVFSAIIGFLPAAVLMLVAAALAIAEDSTHRPVSSARGRS